MNYRYRVKGVSENAFILRGAHFRIGSSIDTVILESELAFVKERCRLDKVEDIQEKNAPSRPIPTNSTPTKGVKNELSESTSGANKGTSKKQV